MGGQNAKVVVLWTPLRSRARAAFDHVELFDGGTMWEVIVARLTSEFDSLADR